MSKIKMRCITCGKWFQSANAKEVTCPDCMQKARKEKLAAKTVPPTPNKTPGQATRPAPPPPPKPKPAASGGTSHWLDTLSDVKVGEPDQPPRPKILSSPPPREQRGEPERPGYRGTGPGDQRDERGPGSGGYREGGNRGPTGYREREGKYHGPAAYSVGELTGTLGQRPRQPIEGGLGRGPRPGAPGEPRPEKRPPGGKYRGKPAGPKTPKPAAPPKPKREKIPPPEPFKPTPEQVAQVEARYLELAVPAEFDGIRTQIATELSIPKKAVKQIVKELRERQDIPSWWDLETYKGDSEELAKIRAVYEPYLPLPPIGVHKTIAEALSLKPGDVYQAIKLIRQEMNLPQYNDPTLHGLDPESVKKRKKAEPPAEEQAEPHPEAEESPTLSAVAIASEDGAQATETTESHPEVEVSPTVSAENGVQSPEPAEIPATVAANSDGVAEA